MGRLWEIIKIKTKSKISCKNSHIGNVNVSMTKGNQQNIKSGLQLLKTILCEIVFCVFPFSSVDLFKNLLPTVGNFKMGNH